MCESSQPSLKNFYESVSFTLSDQQRLLDDLAMFSSQPLESLNDECGTSDDILLELFPAGEDYTRLFDDVCVPLLSNSTTDAASQHAARLVENVSAAKQPAVSLPETKPVNSANAIVVSQSALSMPLLTQPEVPVATRNEAQVNQISTNVMKHNSPLSHLYDKTNYVVGSAKEMSSSDEECVPLKKVRIFKPSKRVEPNKEIPGVQPCRVVIHRLAPNHPAVLKMKLKHKPNFNFLSTYKIPKRNSSRVSGIKVAPQKSDSSSKTRRTWESCVQKSFGVGSRKSDMQYSLRHLSELYRPKRLQSDNVYPAERTPPKRKVATDTRCRKTSKIDQSVAPAKTVPAPPAIAAVTRKSGAGIVMRAALEEPDPMRNEPQPATKNNRTKSLSPAKVEKYLADTVEKKLISEYVTTKESVSKLCILEEKDIVRLMKQAIAECLSSGSFTNFDGGCDQKAGVIKKRVQFEEPLRVRFVDERIPDECKRETVYAKGSKISGKKYEQAVERMMRKVLKWNPRWLEKHRQLHLKDDDAPNEMEDSTTKYRKLLKDTAVQELWKMMYDSHKATTNGPQRSFSCDIDSTDRSVDSTWKIHTKRKLDSSEEGGNIVQGDLTILSVYVKQRYEVACWLKKSVFAYVLRSEIIGERVIQSYENITFEIYSMDDAELKIGTGCATVQRIASMHKSQKIFQMLCLSKIKPLTHLAVGSDEEVGGVQLQPKAKISPMEEQKEAVNMCLNVIHSSRPSLHLIEGAPGTGKTQAVVNFVKQLSFSRNKQTYAKILIVMPTESAADAISGRLLSSVSNDFTLLRYGESEKIDPRLNRIELEQLMKDNENEIGDDDVELEIKLMTAKRNARMLEEETLGFEGIMQYHDDIMILRKKTRIVRELVLDKADVVIVSQQTCFTSSFQEDFMYSVKNGGYYHKFTLCIIDNAEGLTDVDMLIPISTVTNLILVGDSSQNLISKRVSGSPFNRIFSAYTNQGATDKVVKLKRQYRMHSKILDCLTSTCGNQLNFYKDSKTSKLPLKPVVVVNFENNEIIDHDKLIDKYAAFAKNVVLNIRKLKKSKEIQIGIIVERKKQREVMEDCLSAHNQIAIGKLYDFEGLEKDVIILCLPLLQYPEMYFYAGMSRAKHSLIVCGDFSRVKGVASTDCLLNFAKRRKSLQSWEKDPKDFPFHLLTYRF